MHRGVNYQSDVAHGAFVTLYNAENLYTYQDIMYKATGQLFLCESGMQVIAEDRTMMKTLFNIVDIAFSSKIVEEFNDSDN